MKKKLLLIINLFLLIGLVGFNINIKAETRKPVSVSLTAVFGESAPITININTEDKLYGTKLRFDDEVEQYPDYRFAYWEVNGVIQKGVPFDYAFTLTNDMNVKAYFTLEGYVLAVFIDANGKVLNTQHVIQGGNAIDPSSEGFGENKISLPSKPGFKLAENIWGLSLENLNMNNIFILQYELDSNAKFNLTINGIVSEHSFNDIVTVDAPEPNEGEYFLYWKEGNQIVSYNPSYSFSMLANKTLTAVYGETNAKVTPLVTMSNDLGIKNGYRSYLNQFYIPEGYTLIEFGLIYYSGIKNDITLDTTGIVRHQGSIYVPSTKEWVMSKAIDNVSCNSIRAYLVIEDSINLITVYSSNVGTYDPVKPVISGTSDAILTFGHPNYSPLNGVTAIDNNDGNITSSILVTLTKNSTGETIPNPVYSTLAVGLYTLTYSVKDLHNNLDVKTQALRIVTYQEPFFSEYGAGTMNYQGQTVFTNDKWLEIYNPNTFPINLTNYKIRLYTSSTTNITYDILSGTIMNARSTLVLCNSLYSDKLKPNIDKTSHIVINGGNKYKDLPTTVIDFDGTQGIALLKNTTIVDIIGDTTTNTNGWTIAGNILTTKNSTMIRHSSVIGPDGTFKTTANDWIVKGKDTFDGIGSHYYNPTYN